MYPDENSAHSILYEHPIWSSPDVRTLTTLQATPYIWSRVLPADALGTED